MFDRRNTSGNKKQSWRFRAFMSFYCQLFLPLFFVDNGDDF